MNASEPSLVLRRAAAGDADAYREFLSRNWDRFAPSTPADAVDTPAKVWSERFTAEATREVLAHRYVVVPSQGHGRVLAECKLDGIVMGVFRAGYMGFRVDAELEGCGLMSKAVANIVSHAFSALGLHRVMANHRPENERSARLLRRLGFQVEGFAPRYLFLEGAWRDHVLTSMIAEYWQPDRQQQIRVPSGDKIVLVADDLR